MKKIISSLAVMTALFLFSSCNGSEKKVVKAAGYSKPDASKSVSANNELAETYKGGVILSVKPHDGNAYFQDILIDTSNDKSPDMAKVILSSLYENAAIGDSVYLVIKNGKITDVFPVIEK